MFAWARMVLAIGFLAAAAALQGCGGGGSGGPTIDTGGETPPPTTDTGGETPPPTTDTGGETPPPTTDTGGETPPPTTDTGGETPPPTTDTGGETPPPTTDTGGETPAWTPLAGLPTNHELSPGVSTMQPGEIYYFHEEEDVTVSCPASGPACVLRVTADGTVQYELTGGAPSVGDTYTALRNFFGGDSPMMSVADTSTALRRITSASDFWWVLSRGGSDGSFSRQPVDCSGNTCIWPGSPSFQPTVEENVSVTPFMRWNGVELHVTEGEGIPASWDADVKYDEIGAGVVLDYTAARFGWWGYYRAPAAGAPGEEESAYPDYYWEELDLHVWGDTTDSNPVAGSATWSGVLIGHASPEESSGDYATLLGDATLTVSFGNSATVDVNFANILDIEGRNYVLDPWTSLPLSGGNFEDGSIDGGRYIEGFFFGPNAEEMGGLLVDDGVSNTNVLIEGAFAGVRSPSLTTQ